MTPFIRTLPQWRLESTLNSARDVNPDYFLHSRRASEVHLCSVAVATEQRTLPEHEAHPCDREQWKDFQLSPKSFPGVARMILKAFGVSGFSDSRERRMRESGVAGCHMEEKPRDSKNL